MRCPTGHRRPRANPNTGSPQTPKVTGLLFIPPPSLPPPPLPPCPSSARPSCRTPFECVGEGGGAPQGRTVTRAAEGRVPARVLVGHRAGWTCMRWRQFHCRPHGSSCCHSHYGAQPCFEHALRAECITTAGVWTWQGSRQDGGVSMCVGEVHGSVAHVLLRALGKPWKESKHPQLVLWHARLACCASANSPAMMPALHCLAVSPLHSGK